jgi:hypothetical protein
VWYFARSTNTVMPHTGSTASRGVGVAAARIWPAARRATRSASTATAISALSTGPRSSPAGAWIRASVTNHTLDLRFVAFEERSDRKLDALESRLEARVDALAARMELRFAAVDARFAEIEHRFDRFEHQLLAQVDRRLRAQAWMTISTIVAAMGILVAAVRL